MENHNSKCSCWLARVEGWYCMHNTNTYTHNVHVHETIWLHPPIHAHMHVHVVPFYCHNYSTHDHLGYIEADGNATMVTHSIYVPPNMSIPQQEGRGEENVLPWHSPQSLCHSVNSSQVNDSLRVEFHFGMVVEAVCSQDLLFYLTLPLPFPSPPHPHTHMQNTPTPTCKHAHSWMHTYTHTHTHTHKGLPE